MMFCIQSRERKREKEREKSLRAFVVSKSYPIGMLAE